MDTQNNKPVNENKEHQHLQAHELETKNDLAKVIKDNAFFILGIACVVVALVLYVTQLIGRAPAENREFVEATTEYVSVSQEKAKAAQSPEFVADFKVIAEDIERTAKKADGKTQQAFAMIKSAEALRSSLHYGTDLPDAEKVKEIATDAKSKYERAASLAGDNITLLASAKLGIALCEEEMGNITAAKDIYTALATEDKFSVTFISEQAQTRLEMIDTVNTSYTFVEPAPEPEVEQTEPEVVPEATIEN